MGEMRMHSVTILGLWVKSGSAGCGSDNR